MTLSELLNKLEKIENELKKEDRTTMVSIKLFSDCSGTVYLDNRMYGDDVIIIEFNSFPELTSRLEAYHT